MNAHRLMMTDRFSVRRARLPLCLLLLAALLTPAAAHGGAGDKNRPDQPPEIVRSTAGTIEIGTLSGTPYRIDIPASWNHGLVVYFHGYAEGPTSFHANSPLNEQTQPLFDRGFAVIQSAYSAPGWALAEAYPETEQLRLYFIRQYGQPAAGKAGARQMETIVAGGSMGGALVTAEIELNPKVYAGGLDLCGSVGPSDLAFQRRFAWRAAFDFYFPGLMPPLVPVPADFHETLSLRQRIEAALTANPGAATAMRNLTGLHSDKEVAANIPYYTFVIGDMQRRAGGSPFDNRNFLYTGTSPTSTVTDNLLNDGVKRYTADPRAREYLMHHYTPTGHVTKPILALHTTYDPRIPGWTLPVYAEQVAVAGFSQNLVQQYVRRDGHCTFTPDEIGRTFDELLDWVRTGRRPTPGLLPPGVPRQTASTR